MISKELRIKIKELRKKIKFNGGLDSCSFVKYHSKTNELEFHIKAKNNCGYRSCDVDENILVKIN